MQTTPVPSRHSRKATSVTMPVEALRNTWLQRKRFRCTAWMMLIVAQSLRDPSRQDTAAVETGAGLMALLLPTGAPPSAAGAAAELPSDPARFRRFALAYSPAALAGWAKQRSPACAAASVAGAWNALLRLPRDHPRAQSQARERTPIAPHVTRM